MRFKLDENLDAQLASILAKHGHDVATVLGQQLGGRSDEMIYQRCVAERRVLITLDLDFSNPLRFPVADTVGIIVLRPIRPLLGLIEKVLSQVPTLLEREQLEHRLWIVEPGRLRIFNPPDASTENQ
jgi:predicted nuclease of predicted toxin-antitoxin system